MYVKNNDQRRRSAERGNKSILHQGVAPSNNSHTRTDKSTLAQSQTYCHGNRSKDKLISDLLSPEENIDKAPLFQYPFRTKLDSRLR
jgi:hypothetical protein